MYLIRPKSFFYSVFLCLNLFSASFLFAGEGDWRPVSAEELAMKTPKVEADADAEAIFWEVKIDDSPMSTTIWKHYVRIKIFTERGREKFSKIRIIVPENGKVEGIAARVVKTDGTIFELKKEDLFEQEIVRTKNGTRKAVSFVAPNLEIGSVFEYKFEESSITLAIGDKPLILQRDIPVHKITYIFKPVKNAVVTKSFFNMSEPEIAIDAEGFYHVNSTDVPALVEEPQMPPEKELARWMAVSYSWKAEKRQGENFWASTAAELAAGYKLESILKPDEKIKKKALEIVGNAATDEEKLARLFEFCRTKIKNLDEDGAISAEEKKEFRQKVYQVGAGDSPFFTLKKSQGFSLEINELFAALAASLNFETRYAFTGNGSELFFSPKYKLRGYFHFACIAVKIGKKWLYFDPAAPDAPFGMLSLSEENQYALLVNGKVLSWDKIPVSAPEKSLIKRGGKLKLSAGDALEGNIRLEYSGHLAMILRQSLRGQNQSERDDFVIKEAKQQNQLAEISDITIENLDDKSKNPVVSYKVKIPNYASRTGTRIFLQPGFFEYGAKPLFTSNRRIHPIYFEFAWTEEDDVEIEIPPGFFVENLESPAPADSNQPGSDAVKIFFSEDGRKIKYERKFIFGKDGKIYFPAASYDSLKNLFDEFYKIDSHLISLRQK